VLEKAVAEVCDYSQEEKREKRFRIWHIFLLFRRGKDLPCTHTLPEKSAIANHS
jgi:hypothetical protein